VLKRLRKAIEPETDESHFLITVRGHGITLTDGEISGGEADNP
jgi:DNA-binding winged helix-turn-helix (wHTH) protein